MHYKYLNNTKEETNKKGRANSVTIFHADAPQLSANPSWCLWHRKVITKTEHTQQNKIIRINKTQERKEEEVIILWGAHKEHKAEAADTGIIIARIY